MAIDKRVIYILEVAEHCGLEARHIYELVQHGLIHFHEDREDEFFGPEDLAMLRRIRRLSQDMGVNYAGIEIILQMRERMLRLQQELQSYRRGYSIEEERDILDLE